MVRRDEPSSDTKAARAQKLAAALRENLKRRKQQARLRQAAEPAGREGENDSPPKE
jgi:hypothetical protein